MPSIFFIYFLPLSFVSPTCLLTPKGHGTCQAMANITDMLNGGFALPNQTEECTLSTDCQEITCIFADGKQVLEFIFLPCFSPPAVRIVFSGSVYYDHTFYQTEQDALFPPGIDALPYYINVQLEHPTSNDIRLQVNI